MTHPPKQPLDTAQDLIEMGTKMLYRETALGISEKILNAAPCWCPPGTICPDCHGYQAAHRIAREAAEQ